MDKMLSKFFWLQKKERIFAVFLLLLLICLGTGLALYFLFYKPIVVSRSNEILQPLNLPSNLPEISKDEIDTENSNLKLLAVGDIMLDRSVWKKTLTVGAGDYNFPFAYLTDLVKNYDIRIANLEGPVTDYKSVVSPSNLQFTFSPNYLIPLSQYFDVVSLANNHTNNFGKTGLEQTRNYLNQHAISYFGDPYNNSDYLSTIIEENNFKLAFIGYNQLANTGNEMILAEIKKLKSMTDFVIVFPHWGIEYRTIDAGAKQIKEGREFIDAGADLIIGTHPHVVQPSEIYQNKMIYYSLGNFIFDQYFSLETMNGLALDIELSKELEVSSTIRTIPIEINSNYQPRPKNL